MNAFIKIVAVFGIMFLIGIVRYICLILNGVNLDEFRRRRGVGIFGILFFALDFYLIWYWVSGMVGR